MVVSTRDILIEVGGQHLAKGVEKGLELLDKRFGKEGAKPHEKPSFWLKLFLGVGSIVAAMYVTPPYDRVLLAKGVHYTTALWDDAEAFFK